MRPFLLSAALLSAAFVLGCQEQASSLVGPESLGILLNPGGPHPHGGGGGESGGKALLFNAAGVNCDDGATNPESDPVVGNVSWAKVFVGDAANGFDHVHLKVNLQDAAPGTYEIRGNQREACAGGDPPDFVLGRFNQRIFITVKPNGKGSAGGQLNFPVHPLVGLETKVWVTVVAENNLNVKLFRSAAITVVLPAHTEHQCALGTEQPDCTPPAP